MFAYWLGQFGQHHDLSIGNATLTVSCGVFGGKERLKNFKGCETSILELIILLISLIIWIKAKSLFFIKLIELHGLWPYFSPN